MSRELNEIFDVKSRQARRNILDKFDLSKEDKNKVLNKIDSAGGETSGGGSGSGDEHVIYYKCDDGFVFINDFMDIFPFISNLRSNGPNNRTDHIMYHPIIIAQTSHGSMSQPIYLDAFAFMPIKTYVSGGGWIEYSSYEELREAFPTLPPATRITAEEYWADYNAE